MAHMEQGTVYRSTGSWYSVKANDIFYDCRLVGKLRMKGIQSTNPVVVGDHVLFEIDPKSDSPMGTITEIVDRKNGIIRKSVNLSKRTHIIAANIDQVFLLVTLKEPPTHLPFIDRFLVAAEAYQIPVVLLFNKSDTYTSTEASTVQDLRWIYEKIGYKTVSLSATQKKGIKEVQTLMQNKVSMISGHSGVGKTTLINAMAPGLNLKTAAISSQHMQGQHTTTFTEMYDLDTSIKLIDTPGIKGFGVVDMAPDEITHYFPEFVKVAKRCKFHNCRHLKEPDCAVLKGVEEGEIAASRYASYKQLLEEDTTYRM